MKNIIKKLNAIDVGAFLKKKDAKAVGQVSGLDRLLYKVDKKLWIVLACGITLIVWGVSSVFGSLSARSNISELDLTLSQLESDNASLNQQIKTLKSANNSLLEAAKNAPASSNELLARLSDIYNKAGLNVLKVSTGAADKPDFIQINAEGSFKGIQFVLSELSKISAALDVKSLHFGSEPNKGVLQMSIGLQFIKPPKLSSLPTPTLADQYEYMDGSHRSDMAAVARYSRVQFIPQSSSASENSVAPATPKSDSNNGLDRNPFYVPPSPNNGSSSQPAGAGVDLSKTMTGGAPVRGDGVYVVGCVVGKEKKACLFQMADGSSVIHSAGQKIADDMKIVDIQSELIRINLAGKVKKFKVGEQVR